MLRSALLAAIATAALLVGCGGANSAPEPIIDVNGDRWICFLDGNMQPIALNTDSGYSAPAEFISPDSREQARWIGECRKADTRRSNGDDRVADRPSEAQGISASSLTRAYEDNNVAAQRDYGDQRMVISGEVTDLGRDFGDDTIIQLLGHRESLGIPWSVACVTRDGAGGAAANLRPGDTVSLEGVVQGPWLGYIIRVRDCELR